jgi:deazaflavin-dependent oxidoreductase (nitroreductase family)
MPPFVDAVPGTPALFLFQAARSAPARTGIITFMSDLNDQVIAEFRGNSGIVRESMGGHFKDVRLLLLHHAGRRSGRQYVTPLLYAPLSESFLVAGSNGGTEHEPLWVANVEGAPAVTIEVGERTLKARPAILRAGPERDRLYQVLVDIWPDMLQYETHTSRKFPVIRLDPAE